MDPDLNKNQEIFCRRPHPHMRFCICICNLSDASNLQSHEQLIPGFWKLHDGLRHLLTNQYGNTRTVWYCDFCKRGSAREDDDEQSQYGVPVHPFHLHRLSVSVFSDFSPSPICESFRSRFQPSPLPKECFAIGFCKECTEGRWLTNTVQPIDENRHSSMLGNYNVLQSPNIKVAP